MKIYDNPGWEIATLANEFKKAGTYKTQFSNNQFTNNLLPSGVSY